MAASTATTERELVITRVADRDGHRDGWTQCFDRLRDYLKTLN